jgi:hypothetical protein
VFAVALAKADGACFALAYDLGRQKNGERRMRRSPPILKLTSVLRYALQIGLPRSI